MSIVGSWASGAHSEQIHGRCRAQLGVMEQNMNTTALMIAGQQITTGSRCCPRRRHRVRKGDEAGLRQLVAPLMDLDLRAVSTLLGIGAHISTSADQG